MSQRLVEALKKETQLNSLIKRKREEDFHILYYSLWGSDCKKIMTLVDEWKIREGEEKLYTINSWDLPHAFTAFKICRVPALVSVKKGRIRVDDQYSQLYRFFTCNKGR